MASPPRTVGLGLNWTPASFVMLGGFVATAVVVSAVWWPLVTENVLRFDRAEPWWARLDWLLAANFGVMAVLMSLGARLRRDAPILLVAAVGGLCIETWGTRTGLWHYFTGERPPLWILPAWPVATLAIDRLTTLLKRVERKRLRFDRVYWVLAGGFFALMLYFTRGHMGHPYTLAALTVCLLVLMTPGNRRTATLTFLAGSALGYFLERWGTTRECWTYHTGQTPPLFSVLAHGMASLAFWRGTVRIRWLRGRLNRGGTCVRRDRTPRPVALPAGQLAGSAPPAEAEPLAGAAPRR